MSDLWPFCHSSIDSKVGEKFFKIQKKYSTQNAEILRCTGSWGILAWGEGQFGEVPVGGGASWEKCQFGEVLVGGSASWGILTCQISWAVFIPIHSYLMNARYGHYF